MGSQQESTRLLGLDGYRVERPKWDGESARGRVRIWIERRGGPRLCLWRLWPPDMAGARREGAHLGRPAVGEHAVTLVYRQRRLWCRACGIRTARVGFADDHARITRRLRQVMSGKFTVVTPNFNMAEYLPETIESVLSNLRSGDEYFVIDGGSVDGSRDIIGRYERHITGWLSEGDRGYADAVAKGFARASGDFLCWINSGDLLLPGALPLASEWLGRTGADLIFGDDLFIDEDGQVIMQSTGRVGSLRHMTLFGGWTPLQDACFWRQSLYQRVGGLDIELKCAADYDFFLRASQIGQCEYVPITFSAFRRHAEQKSLMESVQYRHEREAARRRALRAAGGGLSAHLNRLRFFLAAVWRARVTTRFRPSPVPRGIPVASLSAGEYARS